MRMKKSMRVKKSARVKKSPRSTGRVGPRMIWLAVIGIMGAAVLIGARQSSQPTDTGAVNARAESVAAAQAQAKAAASAVEEVPVAALAANATVTGLPVESAKGLVPTAAPVTISGCLEQADETFRLKDTAGADAPKSRSWKSGFLKKGPASIALVDAPKKLKLPDHVGQRVSVTGMLVDHEMQVRSLQRVRTSCI
jgi:hypothetical protein